MRFHAALIATLGLSLLFPVICASAQRAQADSHPTRAQVLSGVEPARTTETVATSEDKSPPLVGASRPDRQKFQVVTATTNMSNPSFLSIVGRAPEARRAVQARVSDNLDGHPLPSGIKSIRVADDGTRPRTPTPAQIAGKN